MSDIAGIKLNAESDIANAIDSLQIDGTTGLIERLVKEIHDHLEQAYDEGHEVGYYDGDSDGHDEAVLEMEDNK